MISVPRAVETSLLDEPGIVQFLRVMLVATLASALAISVFTLFLRWRVTAELALIAGAASLVALVLSRSGRIGLAILLPLLTVTYSVLHLAARSKGIDNIGIGILPVLVVLGGLLLRQMMTLFFTAAVILAVSGMLAIRYFVLRVQPYSANDMGDLFIFAVTCAIAALVGRLLSVRIEEGLRQTRVSESRYRRMFENVQDVYYEMGTNGVLSEVSPASASLFGIPREEMIGHSLAAYCTNTSEFDELLAATRTHARVSNRELVIGGSDTAPRHVLVDAALQTGLETGQESVIGSIRDITEKKRAEEALHDSEARLRLALDAAGAGTFDFYPQSGKLIWSDITKNQFGMPPDAEFDQNMFLNSVHPDDRERIRQTASSFAVRGSDDQLATEYRIIGAEDGIERWIAVRGRMLFDSRDRPTRFIGITLDITQRKRLEEQLRRRAEEAQKIMDVAPVAVARAKSASAEYLKKGL
jgi:PAS domain S-box-containing protein